MKFRFLYIIIFLISFSIYSQKDSLNIDDYYADDQLYLSVHYSQLSEQPSAVSKSNFSYSLSTGFIKDIILNKEGTFSFAAGIGYGYDYFSHELKVDEFNNETSFSTASDITNNKFKVHNLEFPLEVRWRTSTAKEYSFWRIYTGVKFLYNLSNKFDYTSSNASEISYKNVSSFNNLQYGLTFSAGYDEFNINVFYGLTPIFKNASINEEAINTKVLKFGLIFYLL
ncbi:MULTISPECIES: porin family protein [Polaribacter]|uniref:Porin family protein n=1 Tax=Polaribacter marinaquae TaxID=1642819 RepID=A0ABZ2TPI7_9FLAO